MPDQAAPNLTLDVERQGTTTTIYCHGRLVSGLTEQLYATAGKLIPESKHIVLDLRDLAYMDSMGLGAVVRLYVSARAAGCTVELVHIGKRVRDLLELTHVWDVFATVGESGFRF